MPIDSFLALSTTQRVTALLGRQLTSSAAPEGLLLGIAEVDHKVVSIAATRAEIKKGTLGVAECDALAQFVQDAARSSDGFIFLVDSAGARLDEGLPIQGALRRAAKALTEASLDGLDSIAIFGRNAFGGASLLAYALGTQAYSMDSRLAMSGPRILQRAGDATEEAVADVISGPSRCRQSGLKVCERGLQPAAVRQWLRAERGGLSPLNNAEALKNRVLNLGLSEQPGALLRTADDSLTCTHGVVPGAADLLRLIQEIEEHPEIAQIHLGWVGHSLHLNDEAVIQSAYLARLSRVLCARARSGRPIQLIIQSETSGGIYIALASGASQVVLGPNGRVITLPESALQSISKNYADFSPQHIDPLAAGAVDTIAKE